MRSPIIDVTQITHGGTVDPAPPSATPGPPTPASYSEVEASPEFGELRHSYRVFAFPVTVAFLAWYLLYVLLSSYAGGFMATKVVGHINVAFVFGLAQFLTTFLIAWIYARYANARLDPGAEALKARLENRTASVGLDPAAEVPGARLENDATLEDRS
ncbi:DUF485 domain-containing protein [Streptomyces sp. SID13666]|uniref:DUF485 domain-containing protein n=1 Tax=Streptomyces TaxID=1883 RepID=UPI0011068DB8|nr:MULTISPECIES: DUF485 domain-containing protein [unclassified Streptomyces]NEA60599.1 DUF485 domain-containing protein [Streptomyces sp. SID13666]NEA76380.1 DUF485 domain-containing protein [Streptomyces sp. SID13588]QNA72722.1 DUF485 domain-containing protein [Streptomyces sp. So13.3]